ncbi:MAG: hypothetical protein QM758_07385 [Armatimonas sp.]
MGVPNWAILFRSFCVYSSWQSGVNWVPEFLLRSETALLGLAIWHSDKKEAATLAYQQLAIHSVAQALKPFVKHSRNPKVGRRRRRAYKPLVKLYHLCQRYLAQNSTLRWPEHIDPFPVRFRDGLVRILGLHTVVDRLESDESYFARTLGMDLLLGIAAILRSGSFMSDMSGMSVRHFKGLDITDLIVDLSRMHRLMHDEELNNGSDYTRLIADAFLTALEAECPPPDWLPII